MQLDPKAIGYFMIQNSLVVLLLSFSLSLFFAGQQQLFRASPDIQWLSIASVALSTFGLFCILTLINWLYCWLKVSSYRIELKQQGIALDYGILAKNHELLLFNKMQDLLITRSILERILGLSTVVIQNAMGKPERIPGLDAKAAEDFRDNILRYVGR